MYVNNNCFALLDYLQSEFEFSVDFNRDLSYKSNVTTKRGREQKLCIFPKTRHQKNLVNLVNLFGDVGKYIT